MTDKKGADPYEVLHRYRSPSGWVEAGGEPIYLNKRQAEGLLSQGLIKPAVAAKKSAKNEESK